MENKSNRDIRRIKALEVRKPGPVYFKDRQTGKSVKSRDKKRVALPPGKRISKTGKEYFEYRKSRSDIPGLKV
jgi:hypothetical protein